jgi:hypothetical protein
VDAVTPGDNATRAGSGIPVGGRVIRAADSIILVADRVIPVDEIILVADGCIPAADRGTFPGNLITVDAVITAAGEAIMVATAIIEAEARSGSTSPLMVTVQATTTLPLPFALRPVTTISGATGTFTLAVTPIPKPAITKAINPCIETR